MEDILGIAKGILVVGDAHITSKKPSKRKEKNWMDVTLNKIKQIVEIAKKEDYIIVFLGDVFDTPVEESEILKTQFIRILSQAPHTSYTNVGNHDIASDILSDGDTLAMLSEIDKPLCAMRNNMDGGVFLLNGHRIGLGFTPYGMPIPNDVTHLFDNVENVLWFTHHDVVFDGKKYPHMIQPFEIKGCDAVFNGHIHDKKDFIQVGETCWMNYGSLTRMSIDCAQHQPVVVAVNPEAGGLIEYNIEHNIDAFDLTIRQIGDKKEDYFESKMGKISELIQSRKNNPIFSDDSQDTIEEFDRWISEKKYSSEVKTLLMELALKSINNE